MVALTSIRWGLAAALLAASGFLSQTGCSTGPQLPVTTPVVNVSCTWSVSDASLLEDNDCLIDRSSAEAEAETTGNEVDDVQVSPDVDLSVTP